MLEVKIARKKKKKKTKNYCHLGESLMGKVGSWRGGGTTRRVVEDGGG